MGLARERRRARDGVPGVVVDVAEVDVDVVVAAPGVPRRGIVDDDDVLLLVAPIDVALVAEVRAVVRVRRVPRRGIGDDDDVVVLRAVDVALVAEGRALVAPGARRGRVDDDDGLLLARSVDVALVKGVPPSRQRIRDLAELDAVGPPPGSGGSTRSLRRKACLPSSAEWRT